jgi:hypothetical protein
LLLVIPETKRARSVAITEPAITARSVSTNANDTSIENNEVTSNVDDQSYSPSSVIAEEISIELEELKSNETIKLAGAGGDVIWIKRK